MTQRFPESISSLLGLLRLVCAFLALFLELLGVVWFLGSQESAIRAIIWPAPFVALMLAAFCPGRWFSDPRGMAAVAAIYLLASAELVRRTISPEAEWSIVEWTKFFVLTATLLGRFIQSKVELTWKNEAGKRSDVSG